jgi:hypothetical protein
MSQLKIGQRWREYGLQVFWRVTQKAKGVYVVENEQTGQQRYIKGQGQIDTFTFQCELQDGPPRGTCPGSTQT